MTYCKRGTEGLIYLEDGTLLHGCGFGSSGVKFGEVVFTTAMNGYPESMTDPSYRGQIMIITHPLVGNYGVPEPQFRNGILQNFESEQIQIEGLVVTEETDPSKWNSSKSLHQWMSEQNIPGVSSVDTRLLVKKVRTLGSMMGVIASGVSVDDPAGYIKARYDEIDFTKFTSPKSPIVHQNDSDQLIVLVDCGVKHGILDELFKAGFTIVRVPCKSTVDEIMNYSPKGIVFGNGPGNPNILKDLVKTFSAVMEYKLPTLGICLGHQVATLAMSGNVRKMKFGHRAINKPVVDLTTNRCYISTHNHGYGVYKEDVPPDTQIWFVNPDDGVVEGLAHKRLPVITTQFHPESRPGPNDNTWIFQKFRKMVIKKMKGIKKVLVVGSGPIKIAEAAEFDYSGSQSLKAYKEEGIETVLVNSNVATVQTSYGMADKLYMVPVTWWSVEKVIEQERPDAIAIGFGGQTALNVGVDLFKKGVLDRYGIKVLGTPIEGIERALSREKFRETMIDVKIPVPPSFSARSADEALEKAEQIGYPVMVRVSFNLGGRGSTVAWDKESLRKSIDRAFSQSYIGEVLVEKYLHHWKELEYEVVRDSKGNSAVIACVENLDPMGVHTGESIVITPCQTLDNREFQEMRTLSMRVAESISLVGECNVQFALDPNSYTNYVIETNPRMSRSSALASKATGYPLAYVSAKLSLGYTLEEILNKVSGATCACFEPSLDYVVVKIPRWDLQKFEEVYTSLSTEMKSVGEIMSIGRSFEEALQKGIRMLDIGEPGVVGGKYYMSSSSKEDAIKELLRRTPYWPVWAAKAFKEGASVEEVYKATGVDKFFLRKIENIVRTYEELRNSRLDDSKLRYLKSLGFSDEQIANATGTKEEEILKTRLSKRTLPNIKLIDTLAGEWPAVTNYLYLTYVGSEDDIELNSTGNNLLIVGAGGFRIGVSVEFDWGVVELMKASLKYFDQVAVLNYNPETVSTDWDVTRKLYFDEITVERVMDIVNKEKFSYVATFAGGQLGNNIAKKLEENGVRLLGTSGASVDMAEDREKFSVLLDRLGIRQPNWISAKNTAEIRKFVESVGFPVLVRPSYVLSGSSMSIVWNEQELDSVIQRARLSTKYPVVISKFLEDAYEAEIDAVSDGKGVVGIVTEHVEEAGVHSGDSTMSIPTRNIEPIANDLRKISLILAREIGIRGPFNLQFVIKDNTPYVIEMNLRASRSMPFSSKAKGVNLMEVAVKAIMEGLQRDDFFLSLRVSPGR